MSERPVSERAQRAKRRMSMINTGLLIVGFVGLAVLAVVMHT